MKSIKNILSNYSIKSNIFFTALCLVLVLFSFHTMGTSGPLSSIITDWKIVPTSLVKQGNIPLQRIETTFIADFPFRDCSIMVFEGEKLLQQIKIGTLIQGTNKIIVEFPEPKDTIRSTWILSSNSQILTKKEFLWEPPRHWTLYVIKSSHIDIGLHDSQYKQRYYSDNFIDKAVELVDSTKDWPDASRYRYIVEGQWAWLNYPFDRSKKRANDIMQEYGITGLLGVGASHSGNHTQVFGMEELCRSSYYAQEFRNRWNLNENAAIMADNNGITWPLVSVFSNAGIKYLGFFPNSWNPGAVIDSMGWKKDDSRMNYGVNSGVGSRIDVGWNSKLPQLFYWKGADKKSKILVWTNPTYGCSGYDFGFGGESTSEETTNKMTQQLRLLESKYPYNTWLIADYNDNEAPNLSFANFAKSWNEQWRWPELRTVGDLSLPFQEVEKQFGNKIPILSGVITGGWAQHPVSTPDLLSQKMEADRFLPTAEKMATLAFLTDSTYNYPILEFEKAWEALICNDEHGYGTSYYRGRPVYDTWMQKKDWIDKASQIAHDEFTRAFNSFAAQIKTETPAIVVFNPTLQRRSETVELELPKTQQNLGVVEYEDGTHLSIVADGNRKKFRAIDIPPFGYKVFKLKNGEPEIVTANPVHEPPMVENDYYRIQFTKDGTISGIYDKELKKEFIDSTAEYKANQFVFTQDTNETFSSPQNATFQIIRNSLEQIVIVYLQDSVSGASIEQKIILPNFEKRIDIDNNLNHVSDLASDDRWKRFGYYAFPFKVPNGEFRVGLNGCDADAFRDQTGHGTNTYHVARDWAYVGNSQYGIALLQQDNYLIEFGDIHKDKRDLIKKPSKAHFYSYIFNDWLYAHAYVTGPSYINLHYRFTIFSHKGEFEEGKIPQLAERKFTPLIAKAIDSSKPANSTDLFKSFLSVNSDDISLLTLKLSDVPGKGIIARFHQMTGKEINNVTVNVGWNDTQKLTECTLAEQDEKTKTNSSINISPFGYSTFRIESGEKALSQPYAVILRTTDKSVTLNWPPVKGAKGYNVFKGEYSGFVSDQYHLIGQTTDTVFTDDLLDSDETNYYIVSAYGNFNRSGVFSRELMAQTDSQRYSSPAKVGIYCTGLISTPRAWRGDSDNILYLQWGQNEEKDIAYYELFRSEKSDFDLDNETFVSKVEPGPYVIVPFEDKDLRPNTAYYYRVRAVDYLGHKGEPSDVFKGCTLEPKND